MVFQVGESTLSPEVGNLLESFLGCKIAREGILPDRKQFDFFLLLDDSKIIIELKVGGFEKLPYAISQAEVYKETVGADGIIAIVYPEEARREVTRPEDIRDIALALQPTVMVLSPFLKDYYPKISLVELANNLKDGLARPTLAPSIDLVVQTLRQSVQGIALEVKRSVGLDHPVIKETIGSLALFDILSEETKESGKKAGEEATKSVVADLAAYILVNQILLHHILAKTLSLPKRLEPISSPAELNVYFKEVEDIDYKAVYCIAIASNIPSVATTEINMAIMAMRAIQPENLSHDLLGRIFHEFLPQETRKQLGAFYTRPQAAEILAGLSIDRGNEKVLDPACGSGTLLVASYRKKKTIGKMRSHRKIVEDELTGIDIMPFAAHLAALNLTMQSPKEVTNRTRIGIGNSLNLALGDNVGSLTEWLRVFGGDVTGIDVSYPLSKGEVFELVPVNLVIMNPPFTRKERLTAKMKGIRYQSLGNQNYWAYFVIAASSLLDENGKIAAVLPRDFFRGKYSRIVREHLFKDGKYSIRYVVKSVKDWAFSESAFFRDFLVVLQKGNSCAKCCFVYLKKKLSDIEVEQAAHIAKTVRLVQEGESFEDESMIVLWRDQQEILSSWKDLGHLVAFNTKAGDKLSKFYQDAIAKGNDRLITLENSKLSNLILRGLEPSVEHLLDLVFVVRPLTARRIGHSKLILASEDVPEIQGVIKDTGIAFKIPRRAVERGLKTASYVPRLDVGNISDLAILKPFDGLQKIQRHLGVGEVDFLNIAQRARDRLSHLLISRRFDFTSPGTRAICFFSTEKLLPGKAFWTLPTDVTLSKILCLWFNSTVALIEVLLSQTETRGSFIEVTKYKMLEFHIPNFDKCDTENLLKAFEEIKYEEFPPLVEQFSNPPNARQIIDRAVLQVIGYSNKEISHLLPDIYNAMATEMESWLQLMRQSAVKDRAPRLQLHLLPRE